MLTMPKFVAVIYQGMVLDQKAVAVGEDRDAVQAHADRAAADINSKLQGETEGYLAAVLELPNPHRSA